MELEYKKTTYDPIFEITEDNTGLKENDFWINIHFKLKNEEIDYEGIIPGFSFSELIKWNEITKKFIEGKMKKNERFTFIRRIGELLYYPDEQRVEKRLYLFDDVNKYYSIYFNMEEIKSIYENNKTFIDEILKMKYD